MIYTTAASLPRLIVLEESVCNLNARAASAAVESPKKTANPTAAVFEVGLYPTSYMYTLLMN